MIHSSMQNEASYARCHLSKFEAKIEKRNWREIFYIFSPYAMSSLAASSSSNVHNTKKDVWRQRLSFSCVNYNIFPLLISFWIYLSCKKEGKKKSTRNFFKKSSGQKMKNAQNESERKYFTCRKLIFVCQANEKWALHVEHWRSMNFDYLSHLLTCVHAI